MKNIIIFLLCSKVWSGSVMSSCAKLEYKNKNTNMEKECHKLAAQNQHLFRQLYLSNQAQEALRAENAQLMFKNQSLSNQLQLLLEVVKSRENHEHCSPQYDPFPEKKSALAVCETSDKKNEDCCDTDYLFSEVLFEEYEKLIREKRVRMWFLTYAVEINLLHETEKFLINDSD